MHCRAWLDPPSKEPWSTPILHGWQAGGPILLGGRGPKGRLPRLGGISRHDLVPGTMGRIRSRKGMAAKRRLKTNHLSGVGLSWVAKVSGTPRARALTKLCFEKRRGGLRAAGVEARKYAARARAPPRPDFRGYTERNSRAWRCGHVPPTSITRSVRCDRGNTRRR
jgi:hypothetical protein